MAIIKEFKEFFTRINKVTTGNKRDQEANYPISVIRNNIPVSNRFIDTGYPDGDMFSKLLASTANILNPEDSAKLSQQGMVKQSTLAQFIAGTNVDEDGYTLLPMSSQITGGLWHEIDDVGEPEFEGVYTNSGSDKLKFRKEGNRIFIEGNCEKTISGDLTDDLIFILPVGSRVASSMYSMIGVNTNIGGYNHGILNISTNGEVKLNYTRIGAETFARLSIRVFFDLSV